jgi:hypothetical protein
MSDRAPQGDFPTFFCDEQRTRDGALIWSFWCGHCGKRHIHGAGAGHRAAHCWKPNSPFARGYNLDLLRPRGRANKRQPAEDKARAETRGDLPKFKFENYCEKGCLIFWGKPDHSTARELRWDGPDGYGARTFNRQKKVWFDHGAGWGGSTIELICHARGGPKPERLRGKAFIDAWRKLHEMGIVPEGPPETTRPNGKANGARAPDLIAKQTPPDPQLPPPSDPPPDPPPSDRPPDPLVIEVERLARIIDPLVRDRETKAAAIQLGVRVGLLRDAVEAKHAELFPSDTSTSPEEQALVDDFNADHSVVIIGGRTRVLRFENTPHDAGGETYYYRLPTYLRFQDFREFYLNRPAVDPVDGLAFETDRDGHPISIADWWLKHPNRNTYDGVIFVPGAKPVIDNRLNLWTGFGVEPQRGDWSLMRKHIRTVLAADDPAVNTYIVNWLADAVQRPDRQAEVALFFIGGFGTGKGLLGRAMCRIFGQHGRHISSTEHLTGKFNAHLQQCCFLFADEAVAPGDKKGESALKRLITEDTLHIEPKGVDAFEVTNRLHVMGASNHEQAIAAGEKERRYVVQKVAEARQQDENWFTPIYHQMRNGGLGAMLHELLDHDIKNFAPRHIVRTKALAAQQTESLDPFDQWMLGLLQTGVLPGRPRGAEPNEAVSNAYEEEIEERIENTEIADSPGFGSGNGRTETHTHIHTRKRTVTRHGLYDHARQSSPKLKSVSDVALARYLRNFGTKPPDIFLNTWIRRRRGWRFPPLAKCRDRWIERFPDTDWGGRPANWTVGEDDED